MHSKILCIGSILIDELFFCEEPVLHGTSNPARMQRHIGGVISNIAIHLRQLGQHVSLISALGNDSDASWIKQHFCEKDIDLSDSMYVDGPTGRFTALLQPDGNLFTAACMDPVGSLLNVDFLQLHSEKLQTSDLIVMDTNVSKEVMQWVIDFCNSHQKKLIIETVSVAKARKLVDLNLNGIFMISPNEDELISLQAKSLSEIQAIETLRKKGVQHIWVKKGKRGSVFYDAQTAFELPGLQVNVTDTTGAGDAALAAWIAGYCHQLPHKSCVQLGHLMAAEILKINGTVHEGITFATLLNQKELIYGTESISPM